MRYKLVYLSNQRLPTEKAYGIQITKMCESFALAGLNVKLVIPRRKNPSGKNIFDYYKVRNNFDLKIIPAIDFYLPGQMDRLAVFVKNIISATMILGYTIFNKSDVIYSRDELLLFFVSFFKNNICFEAHKFSDSRKIFYKRFKKIGIPVISISQGLKEDFLKFGFKNDKVIVCQDGVDLEEFNIAESKESARSKLRLPEGGKLVGYVGQLRTMGMEKGIAELILSFEILNSKFSDIKLVIVGGSLADIKYYQEFSQNKGLADHIIFCGQKNHNQIPLFLKSFDVLTMPFPNTKHYSEYMSPLKLFEYMASGRPIVSSDLPSIRSILDDNSCVFFNPGSVEGLAQGVAKIIENPDFGQTMSAKAFDIVGEYTWQKRAKKITSFMASSY